MLARDEISPQDIIEMARQAGAVYSNDHAVSLLDDEIIAFAKLVAAKEREACAMVCDAEYYAFLAADAIRARGEA
jgi:hypothetical protein